GALDNALSARDALEMEGHLAGCTACAEQYRQMEATVSLLHSAEQSDTSDGFMARLHARLDEIEISAAPAASWKERLSAWISAMRQPLIVRRAPALGLGVAMAGLLAFVLFSGPSNTSEPAAKLLPPPPVESMGRHVALTASNPFDDPVAAKLDAHSAMTETDASQMD
ncbi:MAG TPA: zf-HC2 domain-containing protein, partial [Chthonomonadales bacterium]|nr:zf-HC2 domain-containing protein [Chthonomonadales bacterium]